MDTATLKLPEGLCPRCGDPIPGPANPGAYPGATSRTDNVTEVCSYCGTVEAMESFALGAPLPQTLWLATNRWLDAKARELLEEVPR